MLAAIDRTAVTICLIVGVLLFAVKAASADQPASAPGEVTFKGSMICNGACVPKPGSSDHVDVIFAINGPAKVRAELDKILADYPADGLDADAAQKLLDQFSSRLKYYISPDSPALKAGAASKPAHYCNPAAAVAITGSVVQRDGKKWIVATRIVPAQLTYPDKMQAADRPFAKPDAQPVILKIDDKLTLKCVPIPPGKFLMGTPFYMWPYFVEEYPHPVTLTGKFYLAEIPVTQEMYQAVMGANPSTVKGAQLPVQDPRFADIDKFCEILSQRSGRKVRLPTDAEWEYAARVGTSSPPFADKYKDQNSSGPDGFKSPLPVKSRKPNAWGLYDMASCWWEITADRGMYNVRHSEVDPRYPPPAGDTRTQRSGRGIVKDNWTICTHEFIGEKGYAGQKFRVLVESDAPATSSAPAGTAPGK